MSRFISDRDTGYPRVADPASFEQEQQDDADAQARAAERARAEREAYLNDSEAR
jgi:hypothetical protein